MPFDDTDLRMCPFCRQHHGLELECEGQKKSFEKLRQKTEEHKRRSLEEEIPWPRPDHTLKVWEAHGLQCAVCRGGVALCGYVRVPVGHPAYGKHYDDVDVRVHGGITFCQKSPDGFWLGFDCGHCDDWWGLVENGHGMEHPGKIWTVDDVAKETERMAEQLAKMGGQLGK